MYEKEKVGNHYIITINYHIILFLLYMIGKYLKTLLFLIKQRSMMI